jgi:hypothetical protein
MSDGGFGDSNEMTFEDSANAAFDTGDMAAALSVTSKVIPEQNFVGAPQDKDEAEAKARSHGYTAPVPYDYSTYQPGAGAVIKTEEADGEDILAPAVSSNAVARAPRYEWLDEFGDIGPEIPELEAILFTDEFRQEAGMGRRTIQGIRTDIVESSTQKTLHSVSTVSYQHLSLMTNANFNHSSRRWDSTQS